MFKGTKRNSGFALPTVLIASVVMLTVLAVSVSSVTAVRTSLKAQYYEQLAKVAGEAGVAYAKACLAKSGNVPQWTDAKPLTPATDCAGNLLLSPAVQVVIVAGGGGGGGGIGGGGGGGGVILDDAVPMTTGNRTVVVGSGGAGGAGGATGGNGGNSSFAGLTAIGGGGGGGRNGSTPTPAGDGGSGGGGNGSYVAATGSGALGGIGEPDQGNDGGNGSAGNTNPYAGNGGGGGGAGAPGGNATGTASGEGASGDGGNGILSDISGTQVNYGAGGAGGRWSTGVIGIPGITGGGEGGDGVGVVATAGQANTGAGGGGGGSGNSPGAAGGSGVVVLRYANNGTITATGGTVSTSGPYKVHRFTSTATFSISATSSSSCPIDPRCSVTVNGNIRSSFKVLRPKLDAEGRASTIPNGGYVELLRSSTGQVWRTYHQPTVQAAVVPDLCDSGTSTALGWANAQIAGVQSSLPGAPAARSITLDNDNLNAGHMYFKKDFVLTETTTLQISLHTSSTADYAELYISGSRRAVAQGAVGTGSVTLPAGCHTVSVKLTNKTLMPRKSQFTASMQRAGAAPLVYTNTSWRVSVGSAVHYSDSDFYADPSIWKNATDLQNAAVTIPTWPSASGDSQAHLITATCNSSCPPSSSTYFRDGESFILTSNREVLVSALCDDDCTVYVDGNMIIESSPWSNINQQTLTLTAGVHHIAARLYNSGSAANPAKFAVAVYDRGSGDVLTRTDTSWLNSNNQWIAGTNVNNDPFSYEDSFEPSPSIAALPVTYDVIVVAGGGGGGGNCSTCGGAGGGGGGGVIFREKQTASNGTYTVTVGGGGSAGIGGSSRTDGGNGGNSVFGSLTAIGGGGGGAQLGTPGRNGGSGGGGSGGGSPAAGAGGNGTAGQGSRGGNGADGSNNNNGGGGGGATGTGMQGTQPAAGDGGPGFISYLTGLRKVYGAGGGGGAYSTYQYGIADDGAGNGANQSVNAGVGYSGTANTGGGGGGGNGLNLGKNGGAGGSGVVIFRIETGAKTVTLGGTGVRSSAVVTVKGVSYTVYTFTSGTSTITLS